MHREVHVTGVEASVYYFSLQQTQRKTKKIRHNSRFLAENGNETS